SPARRVAVYNEPRRSESDAAQPKTTTFSPRRVPPPTVEGCSFPGAGVARPAGGECARIYVARDVRRGAIARAGGRAGRVRPDLRRTRRKGRRDRRAGAGAGPVRPD